MIEFLLIVFAVSALLCFLSLEPTRKAIAIILDLSISAYLILAASLMIWLL